MIIVSAIARSHAQLLRGLRRAVELEVAETMIMALQRFGLDLSAFRKSSTK